MRDPEIFKYDVRVRERMLRAGRVSTDEIDQVLGALPDLEASAELVPLSQPALDSAPMGAAAVNRQSSPPSALADDSNDEAEDGENA